MKSKEEQEMGKNYEKGQKLDYQHNKEVQQKQGAFNYLPKEDIFSEEKYNRPPNKVRVAKMVKNFSNVAFGVLRVSHRDGKYWVIEGNNRLCAAKKREDITHVPCLIFEGLSLKQEATAWSQCNLDRKNPSYAERINSLILQGDEAAILTKKLANKAGRIIANNSSKDTLSCIASMLRRTRNMPFIIERIWPLLTELTKDGILQTRHVEGFCFLENSLIENRSLMDSDIYDLIIKIGPERLLRVANNAAAELGQGRDYIWGGAMLREINKSLRKKLKLEISPKHYTVICNFLC